VSLPRRVPDPVAGTAGPIALGATVGLGAEVSGAFAEAWVPRVDLSRCVSGVAETLIARPVCALGALPSLPDGSATADAAACIGSLVPPVDTELGTAAGGDDGALGVGATSGAFGCARAASTPTVEEPAGACSIAS